MTEPTLAPWDDPAWRRRARHWVIEALASAGVTATGDWVEHQTRSWATVYAIPTSRGRLFFKAVLPSLAHESALHARLSTNTPSIVPELIAADAGRGWLLLADAGNPLRELIRTAADLHLFADALAALAQLQIGWLDRADELLPLGVLDRRPESLPVAWEEIVQDPEALASGLPDGIQPDEHRRLVGLLPTVEALCSELAKYGPPPSLHHDDFHDANVYLDQGQLRIADWGEAGVGHPFFTPMIALRSLRYRLQLGLDAPELEGLRRTYLAAWRSFGAPESLQRSFELAQRLAAISRALTWHHVMSAIPPASRGDDATAAAEWLRESLMRLEAPADPR
jgi:Ser/Thr protein kinase RdoA (MazF antagonist)